MEHLVGDLEDNNNEPVDTNELSEGAGGHE